MFQPPRETDRAVMMACDSNYLPFALHLAWQIDHWCADRRFDILIVSATELSLPRWALEAGIRQVTLPLAPAWTGLPVGRFGPAVYLPLSSVGQLADRYARILKLDSDIWFEGGDIDRLLRVDLGPHALGAVLDVMNFYAPYKVHAREFRTRGLPAYPYFNSGVLLFDTTAFLAQSLEHRLTDRAKAEGDDLWLADQTLLNLVFAGHFAELSPVWNWVSGSFLPLISRRVAARFRHFIGETKPWHDPLGKHDARYAAGYRRFFEMFLPEAVARMSVPHGDAYGFREIGRIALDTLKSQDKAQQVMSRFADEWTVIHRGGAAA